MAEELPVHLMSQEIVALKNIDVVESGYDKGTNLLRQYKNKLGLKISNIMGIYENGDPRGIKKVTK